MYCTFQNLSHCNLQISIQGITQTLLQSIIPISLLCCFQISLQCIIQTYLLSFIQTPLLCGIQTS